jgi:hypothetical protein
MDAHIIIVHIKELFDATSRIERYEISKKLFIYKIIEGSSTNTHMLRMIGYFRN